MKLQILLLLGIAVITVVIAIYWLSTQKKASQTPTTLSPADFKQALLTGKYTVIDLRTPQEIAEKTISDAALKLNYYDADFKTKLESLNRDVPYLLYCRSGNRSKKTVQLMQQLGFTQVADLQGGIEKWQE